MSMTTVTVKLHHWLPRLVGFDAVTFPTTIYTRLPSLSGRLLVHECQHVKQWAETGRTMFLLKYLADYWRGRLKGQSCLTAYLGIGAEAEAVKMAQQYATWQEWSAGEHFPLEIIGA